MSGRYAIYNRFRNFLYGVEPIRKAYFFVKIGLKIDPINKLRSKKLAKDGERNLALILEALDGSDIRAFCAYGTLLGIVRDGGFIPHDTDMDMGILDDASFSWNALEEAMKKRGLQKVRYFSYKGEVTEQCYCLPDGLTVDFFLFSKLNPDTCCSYYYFQDKTSAYERGGVLHVKRNCYSMIRGVKEMEFHGMRIPIPENPEKHLEDVYGPGWKTPDPGYEVDLSKNRMPGLGQMFETGGGWTIDLPPRAQRENR